MSDSNQTDTAQTDPSASAAAPEKQFEVAAASVEAVKKAVNEGTITAEEAHQAEKARGDDARSTLMDWLNAKLKPINQDPAPSSLPEAQLATPRSNVQSEENNPNKYEVATLRTSAAVQKNTFGVGSYYDPDQRVTFGAEPTRGLITPLVDGLMRNKELERVRG